MLHCKIFGHNYKRQVGETPYEPDVYLFCTECGNWETLYEISGAPLELDEEIEKITKY